MTEPDVAALAAGLTKASQQRDDLTIHWDEFCDGEVLSRGRDIDAYLRDMEIDGLAELVPVTEEALEDPFAYERGIEPDSLMWELTPAGSNLRQHLLSAQQSERGEAQ